MAFIKKPQTQVGDYKIGFWEYLPTGYDPAKSYPLVIALHGLGEVGAGTSTSLDALLNNGVPKQIQAGQFPYEAIVLCPQYSGNIFGLYQFNAFVNYAKSTYKPAKLFLTGLSGGANSITEWLSDKNNKVDAVAMCCVTYGYVANIAYNIAAAKMPIIYYVGVKDDFTQYDSITKSRAWKQGIKDMGGNSSIVEFANEGHGVFQTVYTQGKYADGKDWFEWLQAQTAVVTPPAGKIEAELSFPGVKYTLYTDGTWTK